MKEEKTKEQLLEELIRMHKEIVKKVEIQEDFICRFQILMKNEIVFSQIVDNLPYPVAIFKQSGTLIMANPILCEKTKIHPDDIAKGRINLLNLMTNKNDSLLKASKDTFLGKTTVLRNFAAPVSIIAGEDTCPAQELYESVACFPVLESNGQISHSAIVFIK